MAARTEHDVLNAGCGHDFTIAELAQLIAEAVGFQGSFVHNKTKPNWIVHGFIPSGWQPKVAERTGLRKAHSDFFERLDRLKMTRAGLSNRFNSEFGRDYLHNR
jgi:GDP-L-fucose synthase